MKRPRCVSSQKKSFPPSAQRSQNNTLVSWIHVGSSAHPRRGGRGALMGRFFGNVILRRRVRIYPARGRGWRGWEGNRHQPKKSPSNSVGARAGRGGGEGLYGRPRPVPCTHLWGNAITLPPPCPSTSCPRPCNLAPANHAQHALSSQVWGLPLPTPVFPACRNPCVEILQKTERESPYLFNRWMMRRSLLPVPHRQARYRRAERRQATHTERTHVDGTKIGAAKGDACHKLQCLTGTRQHIRGLSGTGGHYFAKAHQQLLVRILEHNMIIAILGNNTHTVAQHSRHPDIAICIERKTINYCSKAESIWPEHLFLGEAAIRLHTEAQDTTNHRLCHIEILFLSIEPDFVREIDAIANDARPFFIEQHNVAIWTRAGSGGPPGLFARRKGHPQAVLAIQEDEVRTCKFDITDFGKKLFCASIGMHLLDSACTNVGDVNSAIFSHCQPIWLTPEP